MKKAIIHREVIHRDHNFIENVDFTKLNEIIKEKCISKSELSRKCGYVSDYVSRYVFRERRLNRTVANTLEKEYGISLDEYCYEQTETTASNDDITEATISDNDTYEFTISFNGELLKKLALASMNEHMSIEDFIFDCILKGIN